MKIEEALYRIISFNNIESSKKAATILPEQTSNVDSYSVSETLEQVEQEVFQALKDITRALMDGISKHEAANENTITTGSAGIDTLKPAKLPVPQSDILVLLVSKKGDAPENPLKIIITYKTGEPLAASVVHEDMAKNNFIDAVVKSTKQYMGISTGNPPVPVKDGKGSTSSGDETGYVVKIPYFSHIPFDGQVFQSIVAQSGEKGGTRQALPLIAPDAAGVAKTDGNKMKGNPGENVWQDGVRIEGARIEGRTIDGQKLLALYRNVGNDKMFFRELSAFAGEPEKSALKEDGERSFGVEPSHTIVIYVDPATGNDKVAPVSLDTVNAQMIQRRAVKISENAKDDITDEAVSFTASGGQEIAKSPVADSPVMSIAAPSVDNDIVLKRLALFVDRVNVLLGSDATADEGSVDAPAGGEPELLSEKLHLLRLQTQEAGTGPIVQGAVKKIIFENEEFLQARIIGLSIEKNNLLRLDMPSLEGALASNKEETLNTIKGLGNSLYERINYFVHPYAGVYADNKEVLQLRASQKDESALLLDKELNMERGGLEKRLNELQLLIERSTLVKQWFAEDNATQAEDST